MKFPFILLAACLAFSAHASAQNRDNCQTSLTVYGVSLRGAAVCDPAWLGRPSAKTIQDMAQPCRFRADAEILKRQGMEKFERDVKANGKDEACAALDGLLRKME